MIVYLVRHTAYQNPDHIVALHLPLELSQQGSDHAHLIGEYFQDKRIKKIFTSPIKRAVQTAQIISQHISVPIQIDNRFTEITNPKIEGTTRDDIDACLYTLDGSEPRKDILTRMESGLQDALRTHQTTVIVSHGDPITILFYNLLGQTTPQKPVAGEDCYIRKGEILKLEFDPGGQLQQWESVDLPGADQSQL